MPAPPQIKTEQPNAALAGSPRSSLALCLRLWRNRRIASPAFRAAIARIPFLGGIARRDANALFRLTGGFIFSQVLMASVRLGLYEALQDRSLTTAELARSMNLPQARLRRLLQANADLALLIEFEADRWVLDDKGVVLAADKGLAAMIRHHDMLYRDLADPARLLADEMADTELNRYWAYARGERPDALPPASVADYSTLMRESQAMMAECILATHDFSGTRVLLDVGGGEGAFLVAAAERYPALQLRLFDLPAVVERASWHLECRGLSVRSRVFGGDFTRDRLPDEVDCVSLIRVLCDHDDERAMAILDNLYRSLQPGTRLVVAEAMNGPSEGARLASAYFGIYFLAMGSGRCRSAREIGEMLARAGFKGIRTAATPNPLIATIVSALR